jgi:hypothetical protein
MFPFKTHKIFVNRWYALLWAAGFLYFAYDVADSAKPEAEAPAAENGAAPENGEDAITALQNRVAELQQAQ